MKVAGSDAIFIGAGLMTCVVLAAAGVWVMSGMLRGLSEELPVTKRLDFTIRPGETRRVAAYVAGGGIVRFVSDSRGAKVRYRLRLEDGHKGSILADAVAAGVLRGELRPQHGSLYEWSWSSAAPKSVHVAFYAKGDFDVLSRSDTQEPRSAVAP